MSGKEKASYYRASLEKRVEAYKSINQPISLTQLINALTDLGCVKAAGALIAARRALDVEMKNEIDDLERLRKEEQLDAGI